MNKQNPNNLTALVNDLPEIYQPVYGHNELSTDTSRTCSDRMEYIGYIYKLLECKLSRPLRILDLGCAQGFFSLSLAQMGATVKGIDFLDKNISVCYALAKENPEFDVTFEVGRVEHILDNLQEGEYDLVMGLSVFHHLVHEHGLSTVQDMIKELAQKVKIGIFELALSTEPLYWGESQAKQPRMLLNGFSFVHEIAEYTTHLSNISRPLFVTSNFYWLLDNQIELFDAYTDQSHEYAGDTHQTTRRYFFTDKLIIKLYRLDNSNLFEANLKEFRREVDFHSNYSDIIATPKLLLHGQNQSECWIVREKLEGRLLLDIIDNDEGYDSKQIIEDVLGELVALEKHDLYHEDLRTWNVLINDQGNATLIDYGSISKEKHDCVWPDDIFLSFLIFIIEVTNSKVFLPEMIRDVSFDLDNLTEPYRSVFIQFFALPVEKLSFAKLYELLFSFQRESEKNSSGLVIFSQLHDNTSKNFRDAIDNWMDQNFDLKAKVIEVEVKAAEVEARATELEVKANEAEAKANESEARANESEAQTHEAWHHYNIVVNSNSWKITKPLRLLGKGVRWFIRGSKAWLTFSPTSRPRRVFRQILILSKHWINANPKLKMTIMKVINYFPVLKQRLKRIGQMRDTAFIDSIYSEDVEQLSPRARRVHSDLKREIEKLGNGN